MTKEEAISVFKDKLNWANQNRYPYVSQREAEAYRMVIKALEQEPKTGHWIESRCDMYECSECDHVYTDLSGERYGMHYCPSCGSYNGGD